LVAVIRGAPAARVRRNVLPAGFPSQARLLGHISPPDNDGESHRLLVRNGQAQNVAARQRRPSASSSAASCSCFQSFLQSFLQLDSQISYWMWASSQQAAGKAQQSKLVATVK